MLKECADHGTRVCSLKLLVYGTKFIRRYGTRSHGWVEIHLTEAGIRAGHHESCCARCKGLRSSLEDHAGARLLGTLHPPQDKKHCFHRLAWPHQRATSFAQSFNRIHRNKVAALRKPAPAA
jgi:hypothetical protein